MKLVNRTTTAGAAVAAAMSLPSAADAHSLSADTVSSVVFHTLADDSYCQPMTSHRGDCVREFDEDCGDAVAFYLVGDSLYWRFYKDGCDTGLRERPRWAGPLRRVPSSLLYSRYATGSTSQGRAVTLFLFRQFEDSGKFSFGDLSETFVTVDLRCSDGHRRARTYDVYWSNGELRRRGAFRSTARDYATDAKLFISGRARGLARTRVTARLRVAQPIGKRVRCRSGNVRLAASA